MALAQIEFVPRSYLNSVVENWRVSGVILILLADEFQNSLGLV